MSPNLRSYHVVFLVDISIGTLSLENDSNFENLLNKTRLSVLKVLTFLENTLPAAQKSSNLKWGFKFFNFGSFITSVERYEFKDFSIKTYEQFESLLENKSVVERGKAKDAKLKEKEQKRKSSLTALSNALKEIVTDYQWDFPDITSPVRPVRGARGSRGSNSVGEPSQLNYVFVLGPCPQTSTQWDRFTGHEPGRVKSDPEALGKVILPPIVSRLFHDEKKIRLFWIDTAAAQRCSDGVRTAPLVCSLDACKAMCAAPALVTWSSGMQRSSTRIQCETCMYVEDNWLELNSRNWWFGSTRFVCNAFRFLLFIGWGVEIGQRKRNATSCFSHITGRQRAELCFVSPVKFSYRM